MGFEIERKFLLKMELPDDLNGKRYRQGYLPTTDFTVVRIRTIGKRGFLTIKGKTENISRSEFEYEIPIEDAETMLDTLCTKPLIEKIRYEAGYGGLIWEIDVFEGENEGLVIAEVELEKIDQEIDIPDWIGEEVSGDSRYFNSNLVKNPFKTWGKK